jgi:hypothetical protein
MFPVPQRKPVKDKEHAHCPITGVNNLAVKAAKPMLTFLGLKVSYETLAFLALFLGSEVVGASKLKENSLVQLLLNAVNSLKPFRTEDDKIAKVKDSILK